MCEWTEGFYCDTFSGMQLDVVRGGSLYLKTFTSLLVFYLKKHFNQMTKGQTHKNQ